MKEIYIPIIIFSTVFIIIIFAIYTAYIYEKRRKEEFKKYSRQIGFSYKEKDENNSLFNTQNSSLFNIGYGRKISNILEGTKNSRNWKIFDYRYTTGGGKSSSTHNYSIIQINPKKDIPNFTLKKENFFHKIGNVLGFKDIDFSSYPNFSRTYYLKGQNENQIKNTFNDELIRFFEQNILDGQIEISNKKLTIYKYRIKPQKLKEFVNYTEKLIQILDR